MSWLDNFPYSNFHELNLDWILTTLRDMHEQWESTKTEWASYKEFIDNYFENLDVQDEINNKIADMVASGEFGRILAMVLNGSATPEIVSSVEQMTNTNKNYVLTSTGHIYYWDGSAWKDSGIIYSESVNGVYGDKFFPSGAEIVAPYNDANTLPKNTISMYTSFNGVSNTPATFGGGLIFTISSSRTATSALQIAGGGNNKRLAWRYQWGGTWSEWFSINPDAVVTGTRYFATGAEIPEPYNNLNSVPWNEIVIYAALATVENKPSKMTGGLLLTLSDTKAQNRNTGAQIMLGGNSNIFSYRTMWGGTWTKWVQLDDVFTFGGYYSGSTPSDPQYNIANLPDNSYNIYAPAIPYEEYPPVMPGGNALLKFGKSDNVNGKSYIAINGNNGGMAFRGTWGGGHLRPWNYVAQGAPTGAISMYKRIGIFGDSFSCGSIYAKDGTSLGRHEHLSWIANLARRNGNEYCIYGFGGATTKTWWTNAQYGYDKYMTDHANAPAGLYFLAFGINDSSNASYLGTPADIGTQADTFYGNYSRIIELIKTNEPNALLFMLGCGRSGSRYAPFTEAIKTIAEYYGLPYADQWDDYYINNQRLYYQEMLGNHPTAQGYASIARAVERMYWEKSFLYKDYFADYTGTDYTE